MEQTGMTHLKDLPQELQDRIQVMAYECSGGAYNNLLELLDQVYEEGFELGCTFGVITE